MIRNPLAEVIGTVAARLAVQAALNKKPPAGIPAVDFRKKGQPAAQRRIAGGEVQEALGVDFVIQ